MLATLKKPYYVASSMQKRLCVLQEINPDSTFYNMLMVFTLEGDLDRKRLKKAINTLVNRHESLRTSFAKKDGEYVQVIEAYRELNVEHFTAKAGDEKDIIKRFIQPFDISKAPLVKAGLIELGQEKHILLIGTHHLVFDAVSAQVFIHEWCRLYNEEELSPLRIQYKDYAEWLELDAQKEKIKKQEAYWLKEFQGGIPKFDLPTDYVRPPIPSHEGGTIYFAISGVESKALRAIVKKNRVTDFMLILTLYNLFLSKISGAEEIVIGTPFEGRNHPDVKNMIGMFVKTLAIKNRVEGDTKFTDFLKKVRGKVFEANLNQDYPFDKLVEKVVSKRDMSHNPIFDVMLTYTPIEESLLDVSGLKITEYREDYGYAASKFDLTLRCFDEGDQYLFRVEYASQLFNRSTIERFTTYFKRMVRSVLENPNRKIAEIAIIPDEEKAKLLYEFNDTNRAYPRETTIIDLFEAQVERTPETVAVVCGNQQLTYRELNRRANQLAHHLQKLGVHSEVLVGICVERSIEMIVGLLGILKAGGAYVLLNPVSPKDRLAFMMGDIQVLLTHQELMIELPVPERQMQIICLDADWNSAISSAPETSVKSKTSPENLAYVIYTSGTTGQPKGVQIEHHSLVNYVSWFSRKASLTDTDKTLVLSSLYFDLCYTGVYPALLNGCELHLLSDEELLLEPGEILQYLSKNKITYIKTTPSLLNMLMTAVQFSSAKFCESLRLLVLGGESINSKDIERFHKLYPDTHIMNHYGPTETTVGCIATLVDFDHFDTYKGVPVIGRPIDNTTVYILDSNRQLVPIGVPGEIHIGGVGLARGYLNRPEVTAKKFIASPFSDDPETRLYKTGDKARYLPDGTIEFLGRLDFQVKIRGFRVEPGEVEAVLTSHPNVWEVVVIAREDTPGDKRLVAYIVPKQGHTPTSKELRDFLKEKLPEYMIPSAFVMLEKLPLTPNGKVDRHALPVPNAFGNPSGKEYLAPRDNIELQLVQIWEDILATHSVGVRDNFFELGGHSLLTIQLIDKIRNTFGNDLPLSVLFQRPTVENLAEILRHQISLSWSPLVCIRSYEKNVLPFFCVHPADGSIFHFIELARYLGHNRPFYGFQAYGLTDTSSPLHSFRDMAAKYIEALSTIPVHGPYLLGGFSVGGIIAYEMAQQLRQHGKNDILLVLLDTFAPHLRSPIRDEAHSFMWFSHNLGKFSNINLFSLYYELLGITKHDGNDQLLKHLRELSQKERFDMLWQAIQKADILPPDTGIKHLERIFHVYTTTRNASLDYTPRPYNGPILLFRSLDASTQETFCSTLGWEQYVSIPIEVYDAPGDHFTMLKQPNVQVLAEQLNTCLAKHCPNEM